MKGLFKAVFQPWVMSLLGLLAVALVIWFVGPLIAIAGREPLTGQVPRLIAILLVAIVWGLGNLRRHHAARKADNEIAAGLVEAQGPAGSDAAGEEVAALRERFEESLDLLRKSRGTKGKLNLYELPWYMIIGPPGAGKSTALLNSGLRFPLAERYGEEAVKGIGGTRTCDWWFTDEAVLLDTAGRYTTQDSDEQVDRGAWEGFLALLKKYRKRRPLNGVLVAISSQDLLQLSPGERAAHARAIRRRVQELYQFFGMRFPVYVLLTKMDLVAGFNEFFDDLGREGREQVWGATFELPEGDENGEDVASAFQREYRLLLQRLQERVFERLRGERDVRRRAAIYGFPRQLAATQDVLVEFLRAAFSASRYEAPPMVRGVYMTSGTQEGTPIDRVMGSLAQSFGLAARAMPTYGGHGRSYFLRDLLKKVVFQEAELAGTNRRLERRRAWLQRATYGAAAASVVLALGAWTMSFLNNRQYIDRVETATLEASLAIDQLKSFETAPQQIVPVLDAVAQIPGGFADRGEAPPLSLGLGLYQGHRLGTAAEGAYLRVLSSTLLPRLMLRLEQQLRQGATNVEYLFQALKTYLMLIDPGHFDRDVVEAWVLLDWEQNLPRTVGTQTRESLVAHLDALLANMPSAPPIAPDRGLVERSRRILQGIDPAQQVYLRLLGSGLGDELPEFRISEAAGPDAASVFVRKSGAPLNDGIPGLFTYRGYWEVFTEQSEEQARRLRDEAWVLREEDDALVDSLGGEAGLAGLSDQITTLYLEDYVQRWEDLIYDVDLVPIVTADQAAYLLQVIARPDSSPLKLLLEAVERETALDRPPEEDGSLLRGAGDRVRNVVSDLSRAVGGAPRPTLPAPARRAQSVADRFAPLHGLVRAPEGGGGQPIDALLERLDELSRYLEAVARTEKGRAPEEVLKAQTDQTGALVDQLARDADRLPQPLEGMLNDLGSNVVALTAGGAVDQINIAWQETPLRFCRAAIQGRYPLDPDSTVEVAIADFTRFFKPGGELDRFFDTYLASFVNTSGATWRWRPIAGSDKQVSAAALRQFQRAARIRDAFFQLSDATPQVSFDLTPITMDPALETFTLVLEGQQVSYDHGPILSRELEWPGPEPRQVFIQLTPELPGVQSVEEVRGPWAWFRVLGESAMTRTGNPEIFEVTFDVGGRTARYQLRAGSAFNPFDLDELQSFRCPDRL